MMVGLRRGTPAVLIPLLICWCAKSGSDSAGGATKPSAIDAAPVAMPSATISSRTAVAWRGTYKSTSGSLYIPADWKEVHWRVKETSDGIGEGTIALELDPMTGRVHGTLNGSLGQGKVAGFVSEGKLTASIVRSDPSDEGFAGTMIASVVKDRIAGTMAVSPATAGAVRTGTFELSPAPDGAFVETPR